MILRINEDHFVNLDNVTAIELRKVTETGQWECVIISDLQMEIEITEGEAEALKMRLKEME